MKEQGLFNFNFKQQLREQGWEKLQNSDTNRSQYWRRKKEQTIGALKDISFFLSKLPLEKRNEILTYDNIFPLIELSLTDSENDDNKELMHFVLATINYYLHHVTRIYSNKNKESPNLSSLTIEHLERTRGICNDIINTLINARAEQEGYEQGLNFLFKTLGRSISDRTRFENFVRQVLTKNKQAYATGLVHDSNVDHLTVNTSIVLYKNPNYYEFKATVHDPFEAEHYGDLGEKIGDIVIQMDPVNNKALLQISIAGERIDRELDVFDRGYVKYFYFPNKQYKNKRSIKTKATNV